MYNEERKCRYCLTLEDEFHFVLECQLYTDLRKTHIKKYFWRNPNVPKFIELMTSNNVIIIKDLAMYIYKSFQVRNNLFYD